MQVVRHHQNAHPPPLIQARKQLIKRGLAANIQILRGLVQRKNIGTAQQRARDKDSLQLAARQ